MVQFRAPDLSDDEFWSIGERVYEGLDRDVVRVINPSLRSVRDIGGWDGVQLGEGYSDSVGSIREVAGKDKLVGRSVHSVGAAERADSEGADFVMLGTIYPTESHPCGETQGVGFIREVSSQVRVPVVAIGGVSYGNAAEAVRNGASGVAVIRAILGSRDPRMAAVQLWDEISDAYESSV